MTIEQTIIDYLTAEVDLPVSAEVPKDDREYIVIERTGGGQENHIKHATVAIQSCSKESLLAAIVINDEVENAMKRITALPNVSGCDHSTSYNFTNTETDIYRYQAVFDITYF